MVNCRVQFAILHLVGAVKYIQRTMVVRDHDDGRTTFVRDFAE